jgi:hypothetical protein
MKDITMTTLTTKVIHINISTIAALFISSAISLPAHAQRMPPLAKYAKKKRDRNARFDINTVFKKVDREPAASTQIINYSPAFLSEFSHPVDQCVRIVAKACSVSYGGLGAPTCVIDNSEKCGLFPAQPGGALDTCFSDASSGQLNGTCRKTSPSQGVTITSTNATLPFGRNRPYFEQYKVLYELYKIPELSYMWSNIAQNGCTHNAGKSGQNVKCAVKTIEDNMYDAAGYVCSYNANAGFNGITASRSLTKIRKTVSSRCSVRPDILDTIIPARLRDAYKFQ